MRIWLIKLWKDGVRYRFLRWAVPLVLSHHHVGRMVAGERNLSRRQRGNFMLKRRLNVKTPDQIANRIVELLRPDSYDDHEEKLIKERDEVRDKKVMIIPKRKKEE